MGNWMYRLFGWRRGEEEDDHEAKQPMLGSSKTLSSHDQAVLELKVQRDRLQDYQKKISYVIARENEIARQKLREGKKSQAMLALKKRKYQENLLSKTQTQLDNLYNMVESLEFARLEAAVFEGLRTGTRVLNELHSEMSIEAVEELMADTRAALDHQAEVDARLSEALSPEAQQEVEAELAELQANEAKISAALPALPNAGTHEPVPAKPAAAPAATAAQPSRERVPA